MKHDRMYADATQATGNTPLVLLRRVAAGLPARVAVKLESCNPCSSVKDRIAVSMIDFAESKLGLRPGGTVIEPTSGNTGIGLAWVCAARGYRCIIVMPDTMSIERRKLLAFFGAELILTPGSEGMSGAVREAQRLQRAHPEYVMPQQFASPANPEAHRLTTAREIWHDTEGAVDIVVSGVGTGGTLTGVVETLRTKKPEILGIAVEPADSPVLAGGSPAPHRIQGIGAGFVPEVLNRAVIDEIIAVDSGAAGCMARRLAREEGILAGISAGANVHAACSVAGRPEHAGKLIVTFICDTGERYLSTWLFDNLE